MAASEIRNALLLSGGSPTRYVILVNQIPNISPGVMGFLKRQLAALWGFVGIRKFKYVEDGVWVTSTGSQNFFHWLFDVLKKLEALDEQSSREVVARGGAPFWFRMDMIPTIWLKHCPLLILTIICNARENALLVSNLAFIPDGSPTGNYRKTSVQGLRSRLKGRFDIPPPASRMSKRIYISRRCAKFRKNLNEDEIIQVMLKHAYAFEIVDMVVTPSASK